MDGPEVIVIGGGVAGLSAGCYLARAGYETCVHEMADQCGGVAVSWDRRGYTFDGATTWLPGSSPPLNMHSILAELIDFDRMRIVDFEDFLTIEHAGARFHVYTDAQRLAREMERISPGDRDLIARFTGAVVEASRLELPVEKDPTLYGIRDLLAHPGRFARLSRFVSRWGSVSLAQFARRFESPRLRELFLLIFPRHEFFSVLSVIFSLSWMHMRCAGYPVGGSRRFVGLLERSYRELGGDVRTGSRVEEILVEDDRVRGVRLADGTVHRARRVVSTADGYDTIFRMLGGRYVNARIRRRYDSLRLFPANIQVSLGLARTFEEENFRVLLPLAEPFQAGRDGGMTHVMLKLSNIDPTFAPPGKTAVVAQLRTHDPEHWLTLRRHDRDGYQEEKRRAAESVVETLDRRYGEVRSRLEALDVATPATYVRYTGVRRGSYQGWAPAPGVIGARMGKTLPGLAGLHMAGQWVDPPGGLPRVLISGRNVAQLIARADGRRLRPDR